MPYKNYLNFENFNLCHCIKGLHDENKQDIYILKPKS